MLKEAIQYVLENMRPEAQNLGNRAYIITQKGAQEVIETPIAPDTVPLHSLDSIVKMIRTEAIHLADVNTPALFVNIPSPTNVVCFSQPDYEQRCHRTVYYSADATDVPGWDAKVTLGFEEAQIALQYPLPGDPRLALCDEARQRHFSRCQGHLQRQRCCHYRDHPKGRRTPDQ